MKKYLFMAIAAIASIALVGCKGDDKNNPDDSGTTPTTDAQVVIRPKTLEVAVGSQEKLRAALNPSKDGVTISYKSDDEAVATVDASGLVTGIAGGTANIIASAEGYKSDTCVVTVVSAADLFAWSGMVLAKKGEAISEPYMFRDTYKCQDFEGIYYVYDKNIVFTSGVGLSGAGYTAVVHAPVTIIIEGEYANSFITWELNFDNSYPKDSSGVAAEGYLPATAAEWYSVLSDSTYAGDYDLKSLSYLNYWDWDATTTENDIDFVGYIKNGFIGDYSNGFFYQTNITWFDLEQGLYGLKMEQNEEGKWNFVQPYEYTDMETKYYEVMPERTEETKGKLHFVPYLNNEKQSKRYLKSTNEFHIAR